MKRHMHTMKILGHAFALIYDRTTDSVDIFDPQSMKVLRTVGPMKKLVEKAGPKSSKRFGFDIYDYDSALGFFRSEVRKLKNFLDTAQELDVTVTPNQHSGK